MIAPAVSFVVIGLNEGAHLAACFRALSEQGLPRSQCEIVYVDSGSDDDSLAIARAAGVDTLVEISRASASAARARNAGLARANAPFVHFVDGDTQLRPGWTREAMDALVGDAQLVGVEGALQEARPDHSLVHRTLALDWPVEAGDAPFLGGNALYRAQPVREIGGFDARLRLGEDPELGVRLRRSGWRMRRLASVMGLHDLDAAGFQAYVRQSYRKGLSCGLVVRATGGVIRGLWGGRQLATLAWASGLALVPVAALAALALGFGEAAWALGLWALAVVALTLRKSRHALAAGSDLRTSLAYGLHTYVSKIPAALGICAAYRADLAASTAPSATAGGLPG